MAVTINPKAIQIGGISSEVLSNLAIAIIPRMIEMSAMVICTMPGMKRIAKLQQCQLNKELGRVVLKFEVEVFFPLFLIT